MVDTKRDGVALEGSLADEPLLMGDIISGRENWKLISLLGKRPRLCGAEYAGRVSEASPARTAGRRTPFLHVVLMVALMLTDEIPNPIGDYRLPAMGKFRCR